MHAQIVSKVFFFSDAVQVVQILSSDWYQLLLLRGSIIIFIAVMNTS